MPDEIEGDEPGNIGAYVPKWHNAPTGWRPKQGVYSDKVAFSAVTFGRVGAHAHRHRQTDRQTDRQES